MLFFHVRSQRELHQSCSLSVPNSGSLQCRGSDPSYPHTSNSGTNLRCSQPGHLDLMCPVEYPLGDELRLLPLDTTNTSHRVHASDPDAKSLHHTPGHAAFFPLALRCVGGGVYLW